MSLMVKAHKASFVHHLMSIMHLIIGLMLRMNSYIIFKEGMKKKSLRNSFFIVLITLGKLT